MSMLRDRNTKSIFDNDEFESDKQFLVKNKDSIGDKSAELKWWQRELVYQIYPRSFQDSNGDGVGDIPGIISRLDYLHKLGVGVLWLSPVYKSPQVDNGYDISDYRDIHEEYGTLADMDELISEARERGIRIIMDLVINHTSDQHPWFVASRDPQSPYRDYYFWRDGREGGGLPNNWTSFFGEECWVYDEKSGQYYLHLFAKGQPDLNFYHPPVLEEIKAIMRFWLERGIAGFRCDVINVIFKESLEDGRRRLILTGSEHYISRPGTHDILQKLRAEVLDDYDCFTVGETVFVTPKMGQELCDPERRELDMIFSFEHMETDQFIVKWFKRRFNAARLGRVLDRWQQALYWTANYLENHDQPRSVSRFGDDSDFWCESAKMLAMLLLTQRGTPFVFQGQEIGMTNFDFSAVEQLQDVESHNINRLLKSWHVPAGLRWRMLRRSSRDNARTPVQWNADEGAGFTTGQPWLGLNSNYRKINVAAQERDEDSVLNFYCRLIELRRSRPALMTGDFTLLEAKRGRIVYERRQGNERLLVLLSFSKHRQKLPYRGDLIISNYGHQTFAGMLEPYEAVILNIIM